jgi:hypothetical protein
VSSGGQFTCRLTRSVWQLALIVAASSLACGRSNLFGVHSATGGAGVGGGGGRANGGEPGICRAGCLCFSTQSCPPGCYSPPEGGCYNGGPPTVTVDASAGETGSIVDAPIDGPDAADLAEARVDGGRVPYRAIAVATARYHTCVILDDHKVKCWGFNDFGQLGYGDTAFRGALPSDMGDALPTVDLGTGRTATAMAAGHDATCAILDDGSVKCWGQGALLGLPMTSGDANRGDQPNEMGDALPALDFGAGHTAKLIGIGLLTACAILDDGTARCWDGSGDGLPAPVALSSNAPVVALVGAGYGLIALFEDGSLQNIPTQTPTEPALSTDQRAVAVGGAVPQRCAVLASGVLLCDGGLYPAVSAGVFSATPPLGAPHLVAIGAEEVDGRLCGILQDGSVRCQVGFGEQKCTPDWCDDSLMDGTISVNLGGRAATALGNGGFIQTCALLVDGNVRCWGGDPAAGRAYEADGDSFDPIVQNATFAGLGPFHDVNLGTRE